MFESTLSNDDGSRACRVRASGESSQFLPDRNLLVLFMVKPVAWAAPARRTGTAFILISAFRGTPLRRPGSLFGGRVGFRQTCGHPRAGDKNKKKKNGGERTDKGQQSRGRALLGSLLLVGNVRPLYSRRMHAWTIGNGGSLRAATAELFELLFEEAHAVRGGTDVAAGYLKHNILMWNIRTRTG